MNRERVEGLVLADNRKKEGKIRARRQMSSYAEPCVLSGESIESIHREKKKEKARKRKGMAEEGVGREKGREGESHRAGTTGHQDASARARRVHRLEYTTVLVGSSTFQLPIEIGGIGIGIGI